MVGKSALGLMVAVSILGFAAEPVLAIDAPTDKCPISQLAGKYEIATSRNDANPNIKDICNQQLGLDEYLVVAVKPNQSLVDINLSHIATPVPVDQLAKYADNNQLGLLYVNVNGQGVITPLTNYKFQDMELIPKSTKDRNNTRYLHVVNLT